VLAAVPVAWAWSRRTERRVRELEARTRAAERLAELGTMTGGLAHEIKNPLSTLGLNVQLLQEDIAELSNELQDTDQQERVGRIDRRGTALLREARRLREILEDFLRYAGRMALEKQPENVNAIVSQLTDFFEPQAAEARVRLRTQLDESDMTVAVDAGLLKQAMLNLMLNATQAMDAARERGETHGGCDELMIHTQRTREAGLDIAKITITDTGPGIAEDAAAHIFEPYFSTKRTGSGLGLPTARRIIEEHAGQLTVHSEPGRGTSFVVTLPA